MTSTVSLSNLFIAAPQIYSLSFAPVYYSTTDLHFLSSSCLLQHNRSTITLSVPFIIARQIYTFSLRLVYYNTTDLHFLFCSCLLRHHRSTLSLLRRGLLQHGGSAHSLSVLFVTTDLHFLFPSVYCNAKELQFLFRSCLLQHNGLSCRHSSKHWTPNHHNKTAQPKASKYPRSHFSPFICCLSVVL